MLSKPNNRQSYPGLNRRLNEVFIVKNDLQLASVVLDPIRLAQDRIVPKSPIASIVRLNKSLEMDFRMISFACLLMFCLTPVYSSFYAHSMYSV